MWSDWGAQVAWVTRGDTRDMQFGLYRSSDPLLRGKLVAVIVAEPQSGADGSITYKWFDPTATPGLRTFYRLQVIADGEETWYGPTEVTSLKQPNRLYLPLLLR